MVKITLRAILPKKKFDSVYWQEEYTKSLKGPVRTDIEDLLAMPTRAWQDKPRFDNEFTRGRQFLKIRIFAPDTRAGRIYNLVDHGARPHLIRARNSRGKLYFQSGYTASTKPRSLSGKRASRSGPFVNPPVVRHPGFEGREFYDTASKEYKPRFASRMEEANKRATKRQNS